MNQLYICKISEYQASGNQIDIPKIIAKEFFGASDDVINGSNKMELNICHTRNMRLFTQIEIQPATNPRFSTKLNSFLAENGDSLEGDDLLVVEKIGRSYCVRVIKQADKKYAPLTELFEKDEKHMLLSASLNTIHEDPENCSKTMRLYLATIKTKPFLILAGISGTGKSRVVRELARSCWKNDAEEFKAQKPRNFEMIQVKPNWHDSSELLGYVSRIDGEKYIYGGFLKFVARAWEEPNVPYFLCLDEMNLAPVEQYFAEYLSVLESRKMDLSGNIVSDPILPLSSDDWYRVLTGELTQDDNVRNRFLKEGISLPPNLVVVGTVNMDETTYAFSRKVLDRAMTIEMNEVDLYGGLTEDDYHTTPLDNPQVLIPTAVEGKDVYTQEKDLCDRILGKLKIVNDTLENTPFKIAYRTRNEFLIYAVTAVSMGMGELQAFDEMVCMKILPRIEGDQKKVGNVLKDLKNVLKNIFEIPNSLNGSDETEGDGESTEVVSSSQFESKSLKKLDLMQKRLNDQYYCSFWN